MSQAMTPAAPAEVRARKGALPGLVTTNYAVRTGAFAYVLLTVGLHFYDRGYGPLAWGLAALQFLVYPHLLFLRAKHSANPVQAELANLYVDAACFGAWMAYLGFPLWFSTALLLGAALNAVVNRGLQGLLFSLGFAAGGAALAVAGVGLHYSPDASRAVTMLSLLGAFTYACTVGHVVYTQNRRLSQARRDVRDSEERYRLIAEHAGDLIAMLDRDGRFVYASPSYARVLDEHDVQIGVDAFRRLHPDDADRLRMAVPRAIVTGQSRELLLRLVDREGRIRQYKTRVQALGARDDESTRVVLVSQDVTDLRESEERLLLAAQALEGMTEGIMITASDGTIVTVNRAFTEITGYAREEVLGRPEPEVRNALQPPEFYEELYRIVERDGYWSGTTWNRRKNGSVYREWRSVRAVREAGRPTTHYVIVFYEVGARPADGSLSAGKNSA